jgi:hypothetical protein
MLIQLLEPPAQRLFSRKVYDSLLSNRFTKTYIRRMAIELRVTGRVETMGRQNQSAEG